MTQRAKEIKIFYDFAERCDDDYALMVKTLKLFIARKPSRILQMLEATVIDEYVETMSMITEDNIRTAKMQLINETGTLF